MSRTWLITGCSSGFGRILAERRHAAGDTVFATARNLDSIADLPADDRLRHLQLDVTSESDIGRVIAQIDEAGAGLDALINNAGYGYFSTAEECDLSEVRTMFETNVIGLMAVTQAALPFLRQRDRSTIVQLSSIAGRLGTPRSGFYQATKWAVEGYTEALYQEVSSFGVRLVLIEPGRFATSFSDKAVWVDPDVSTPDSPYRELRARWSENAQKNVFSVDAQDPSAVVDAIELSVDHEAPFLRIPVGDDAVGLVEKRQKLGDVEFIDWLRRAYHEES